MQNLKAKTLDQRMQLSAQVATYRGHVDGSMDSSVL